MPWNRTKKAIRWKQGTQISYSIFRDTITSHVTLTFPDVSQENIILTGQTASATKRDNCDQIDPVRQFDFPGWASPTRALVMNARPILRVFRNNESINIQTEAERCGVAPTSNRYNSLRYLTLIPVTLDATHVNA